MSASASEPLLSAREAAEILGVAPQRVYDLINQGKLEAYDYNMGVGNRWLKIPKASVEAFMKSCRIAPVSPVQPRYKH